MAEKLTRETLDALRASLVAANTKAAEGGKQYGDGNHRAE